MTGSELLKFVAGPIAIVLGILAIVFRNGWSAAARNARAARGDSERAINSQSPRLFAIAGVIAIVFGIAMLFVVTFPPG